MDGPVKAKARIAQKGFIFTRIVNCVYRVSFCSLSLK